VNQAIVTYRLSVVFLVSFFVIQNTAAFSQDYLVKEDHCEQALHLNKESEALRNTDRKLALMKAEEALQIAEQSRCEEMIALANRNIGIIHFFTGNYQQAEIFYATSLELYQNLGDRHGEAAMIHTIGFLHQARSEFDKAMKLYQESIRIKEEIGDTRGMATTYDNISNIHYYQGNYAEAIRLIRKTSIIWEEAGELEELAYTQVNLAAIYEIQGFYDESKSLLWQALDNLENYPNDALRSTILHNMGTIYYELSDYEQAMALFTEALLIKIDLDDKAGISLNLSNIGSLFRMQGRLDQSNSYFAQALKIDQELGNQMGIATQLAQIAGNLLDKHEPLQAIEYYRQSNDIAGSINARFLLKENYKHLITAYTQARNYGMAYEYMKLFVSFSEELTLSPEELTGLSQTTIRKKEPLESLQKISKSVFFTVVLTVSIVSNLILLFLAWRRR